MSTISMINNEEKMELSYKEVNKKMADHLREKGAVPVTEVPGLVEQIKKLAKELDVCLLPDHLKNMMVHRHTQIGSNYLEGYFVYDPTNVEQISNVTYDIQSYVFGTGKMCLKRSYLFDKKCDSLGIRRDWEFVISMICTFSICARLPMVLNRWVEFLYD